MAYINCQFADGQSEEIEVTEVFAVAFEELQKVEKKAKCNEIRRHFGYAQRKEFLELDHNGDIVNAIGKCEAEVRERQVERECKAKLLQHFVRNVELCEDKLLIRYNTSANPEYAGNEKSNRFDNEFKLIAFGGEIGI